MDEGLKVWANNPAQEKITLSQDTAGSASYHDRYH